PFLPSFLLFLIFTIFFPYNGPLSCTLLTTRPKLSAASTCFFFFCKGQLRYSSEGVMMDLM
ncbi:hypothetical protein, partial [Oscillibacter sp.]|uniref:hypothetical protein n=1 Tax=Oscillibacter sp. TaxID=1945593 RepID=UPI00339698EF